MFVEEVELELGVSISYNVFLERLVLNFDFIVFIKIRIV